MLRTQLPDWGGLINAHFCLATIGTRSLDEASMIPFADDPEVARRVEQATGKTIHCVDIAEHLIPIKNDWINVEM